MFLLSSCVILPAKLKRPLISTGASTYTKVTRYFGGDTRKWMDWQRGDLERLKMDDGYLTIDREVPGTSGLQYWKANVWAPPEEQWNGRILWYFYGAFDDKGDFTHGFSRLANYHIWEKLGPKKPILATLAMGGFWMIDDSLQPKVERLMIDVERQIMEQRPYVQNPQRWLFGMSMGGFNVLQLHLFSERLEFERVMAASSLIPACDPFQEDRKVRKACLQQINETDPEINLFQLDGAMQALLMHFNEQEWNRRSPLEVARRGEFSEPEKVLLVAGEQDEFGFDLTTAEIGDLIGRPAHLHPQNHIIPKRKARQPEAKGDEAQEAIATFFRSALE